MTDLDRLDAPRGKLLTDDELRVMGETHRRDESLVSSHLCAACGDTWPCEVLAVVSELQSARSLVAENKVLREASEAMIESWDHGGAFELAEAVNRLRAAPHPKDVTP